MESVPHALCAIGTWRFLSLRLGIVALRLGTLWLVTRAYLASLATLFFGFFLYHYFVVYPEQSPAWFDSQVKESA